MSRPLLPTIGLVALLAGCGTKWTGPDADGDGFSAADGDCWEGAEGPIPGLSGADIYPGAPDVWYDGVDADCAGNDDFDADGDGYVPEEFLGQDTVNLVENLGALHKGIDCWDAPDDVVSDGAVDADYIAEWRDDLANEDWVAANPDDAFMPFMVVSGNYAADGGAFVQPLPSEVNPEATEDPLYDDVDRDCDGGIEFDQDGDGEDASVQPRRTGAVGTDCVDGSPLEDFDTDNLAGLAAADINAAATDVWYDGVDQDCGGNDDCDADGDSYRRVPPVGSADDPFGGALDDETLLEVCGIDLDYDQDCKDTDAAVAPNPDIDEIYYNGTDDNCIASPGDFDGDKDGDGYWDAGYDYEGADDTVQPSIPEEEFRTDCWDDPDDRPDEMRTAQVFLFDPDQDDLTEPATDPEDVAFDGDGDGSTDEVEASAVYPGAFDRPYDGVDQDCGGDLAADHDWDGDGYDTLYQYDYTDTDEDGVFEWGVRGDDCLDCSDDCADAEPDSALAAVCAEVCDNDQYVQTDPGNPGVTNAGELASASVNPGRTETWYDGTDGDCSRTSDFDSDGDFYGDRAYEASGPSGSDPWDYIEDGRPGYYAGGLNGGGDCNDADADFNPGPDGQAREIWYDGLDHDCGDNDDYDADADGDRTDDLAAAGTTQGQNERGEDIVVLTSSEGTNTDCVDDPALVADANVYSGQFTETWYDGQDNDCAGDDDYDVDHDGYRDDQYAAAATIQGLVTVAAQNENPNTDCVDDTAEASNASDYNPAATDEWYDGEDWDCAGDDDFDADADGYRTEDETATATIQGAETVVALGAAPSTDCVDDPDEDGDAASYNPAATDVWYDGADWDCVGDDDFDADDDGDRTDDHGLTATVQGATTVVTASAGTNTDCVDDPVEDADADQYQGDGSATDAWYDGVDYDCAGNDDYDADADGYRSDEYAALATTQGADTVVSSGENPNTDCVDDTVEASNAASYNPGATEVWYDSEDFDCAGDDDYDADADGYRSDAYTAAATFQGADSVVGTSENPNTDCVDDGSVVTDAASYYPGASDAWYDGKDYDCAEDDDYDQDADGYRSDAYAAAATVHGSTVVVAAGANPNTDCVDTDGDYNPGEVDSWYDGLDHDCADNDDYDADADGYRSDEYSAAPTTQDGAVVVAAGANPNTDCVDTSTAYNPGATDTWYDGLDHDCAEDDDYDADADGERTNDTAITTGETTQDGEVVVADGAADATDCVDTDADYNAAATEVWYDGADWDCLGDDDYDVDGDGYRSDDYSAARTVQGTTVVVGLAANPNTDCVDDTDVDVDAADYNPGETDTWYDGLDHDCVGDDDYDQDGDGDRSDAYAAAATVQGPDTVVASGATTNTDCVDTSTAYYGGNSDTWYDGLDTDCAGNDDYDQDGDGQRSDAYAAAATVQDTTTVVTAGENANTDCVDTDTDYSLGASDAWYDGEDFDCAGNDDYDQDGDGDRSDAYAAAATVQGTTTVVAAGAATNTDCVDTSTAYYGGNSDTWYDGLDTDCAGNDDYDQDGDGDRSDAYAAAATVQGATTVVASGATTNTDCVDTSTSYYGGNTDTWYDGLDTDCAGNDDYDQDADGQRSDAYAAAATVQDTTTVVTAGENANTDCVDTDSDYALGASDAWYDGEDFDCAGNDDYDQDGDGDRSDDYSALATVQGTTTVVASGANPNTDCVDTSTAYYGGNTDTWYDGLDTDCASNDDYDQDADGDRSDDYAAAPTFHGAVAIIGAGANANTDCVDTDTSYVGTPAATDAWYDGEDKDCAGNDDYDADGDGDRNDTYGAVATVQGATTVVAAGANPSTDCVDSDSDYVGTPAATDAWYDGEDFDCVGNDDYDQDGDGDRSDDYAAASTVQGTTVVVTVGAAANTDCVDTDTDYYFGAPDAWYDGADFDCVGDDDFDADGDNDRSDAYAAAATMQGADIVVFGGANPNLDCLDDDATYSSLATDVWYDGEDRDCGDDDDYDADGDGDRSDAYAAAATLRKGATIVASGANPNTDCVDSDANYYLSAPDDWYDGEDWDCMGDDDYDADVDGDRSDDYAAAATEQDGLTVVAAGANPNTDCEDSDTDYRGTPAATDTWYDGFDHDCVGDDDYDADGDGDRSDAYPAADTVQGATVVVASGADTNTDCVDDDTSYVGTPAATDAWYDGEDKDCAGNDDYDQDGDGSRDDGYAAAATTQDGNVVVTAGANPNNDCDDTDALYIIDTFYADADTDGYGNDAVTTEACLVAPTGYVSDNTDCDDGDAAVFPGASETADGVDEDCNGSIDDNGVITTGSDYLKITEFIPNPTGLDTAKEWIEVANPNAFDIVLEEDLWTIGKVGTSPYTIAGPVTIAAGDHVVFGRNDDTGVNGNVTMEEAYGSAILIGHTGAGTGTLYLEYDDPTTLITVRVDEVSYDFVGDWSALLSNGYSIELDYDTGAGAYATNNDDYTNWCLATTQWDGVDYGTPNATNDGCP